MKLRQLVIAALACTSVGAMAAANTTSATTTQSSDQSYNAQSSQSNVASQQSSSQQADSSQVSQLQQALNDKGFNAGAVDGKMGPKTKSALKQFQQKQGLTASGQLDSQTVAALSINASSSSTSTSGMSGTNGSTASGTNGATSSQQPTQPAK